MLKPLAALVCLYAAAGPPDSAVRQEYNTISFADAMATMTDHKNLAPHEAVVIERVQGGDPLYLVQGLGYAGFINTDTSWTHFEPVTQDDDELPPGHCYMAFGIGCEGQLVEVPIHPTQRESFLKCFFFNRQAYVNATCPEQGYWLSFQHICGSINMQYTGIRSAPCPTPLFDLFSPCSVQVIYFNCNMTWAGCHPCL